MITDSDELLALCTSIEQEAAAFYLYLSGLFHETPEIVRILRKIMVEKENHIMQLQLAAKLEQKFEVNALKNVDEARQLLSLVKGLHARVMEFQPAWRNGLRFAIELENKLSSFYADNAFTFAEESFNSLYMAMKSHDEDQIAAMAQYLEAATEP